MDERSVRQKLDHIVNETQLPQRDLWPAIRAKARAQRPPQPRSAIDTKGDTFMHVLFRRKATTLIVPFLFVLALTVSMFSLPSVRASVQNFMEQRFGVVLRTLNLSNIGSSPPTQLGPEQAEQIQSANKLISLAEAQQQVGFTIPQPRWLPAGLVLQGVHVGRGPSGGATWEEVRANAPLQIELVYRPDAQSTQGIFIQITQGAFQGGYTSPREHAQPVQVHDRPAVYIKGVWNEWDQWNESADYSNLSWEHDGFTYLIRSSQLGINREDMPRIAETLP
ncbi:MAG: hypothetical protein MI924_31920 [Chloroflexales bacterium]|nr:hypothetical protein [Chloroflexales bacterium]